MANKLTTSLDLDAKKFISEAKKAAIAADDIEESVDDVGSAGKRAARLIEQMAADMEADLRDTQDAAEKLATAMGDEFVAELKSTGGSVDALVIQLKSIGLTTDDIRTDADELATALRSMSTVGKQAGMDVDAEFKKVDTSVADLGRTTDNTRSVVANFAGNAASELPGVSAAMGPLNMAIGQFAEYATEGNIGLKNFIKAGAGLGVLSIGLAAVGMVMGKFAERAEEAKKEQEALNKAVQQLREGKTAEAAQTIVDQYGDLIRKANELGFTTDQVVQGIVGSYDFQEVAAKRVSQEVIRNYEGQVAGYTAAGLAIDGVADAVAKANKTYVDQNGSLDENADILADVTRSLSGNEAATKDVTRALGASKAAQESYNREIERNIELVDELSEDLYGYEEATLAGSEAVRELEDAYLEHITTMGDAEVSDRDKWASAEALRLKEIETAQTLYDVAGAYAEQKGAVEGSDQAIGYMIEELERQKEKYPGLAAEIDKYIAKLGEIPTTVTTNVRTISGGDYVGAIAPGGRRATGGIAPGGVTLVGEQGPELVSLPGGSEVFSAGRTQNMLQNGGGGAGVTINVALTPTAGMDGVAVMNALTSAIRRNGSAQLRRALGID